MIGKRSYAVIGRALASGRGGLLPFTYHLSLFTLHLSASFICDSRRATDSITVLPCQLSPSRLHRRKPLCSAPELKQPNGRCPNSYETKFSVGRPIRKHD